MGTTLTGRIGGSSAIADPLTDLEAVEGLSGTGLAARTAPNAWALRTLMPPAAGIAVSAGDGVTGNPTLALANDLAALEGLSATGIAVRTATDVWTQRSMAVSGTGLSLTNADGVAGNPTVTISPSAVVAAGGVPSLAAQSDQETATSTTTFVSPARQQFHPSAAKCWCRFNGTGTIAITESYNVTSLTDNGTGDYTVTINTDFAAATWAAVAASTDTIGATSHQWATNIGAIAAGSLRVFTLDSGTTSAVKKDSQIVCVCGFGDQ